MIRLGADSEDKAMQKRFIQQRLLEEREKETERQIIETARIRKEREEVDYDIFESNLIFNLSSNFDY